ncbi:GNAT family N-acetyltransferase [Cellulomonas denverensis]|nr:GNAT family N-acetyltransferase [Cellulomonas denverensis]
MLTESVAAPRHAYTLVAVDEKTQDTIGFAATRPYSLPGIDVTDAAHMNLQYLAVDPSHRRRGVASALVAEVERMALADRQNVVLAHAPDDAVAFYRKIGWEVVPEGFGYGWLPYASHLLADIADPDEGFPHMAAKVLRPRAVRHAFHFPIVQDRPMLDAGAELLRIIESGTIDIRDLDPVTRETLEIARRGPAPRQLLDFVDAVARRSGR